MVFLVSKRKRHRLSIWSINQWCGCLVWLVVYYLPNPLWSLQAQQRLNHLNHPTKIVVAWIHLHSEFMKGCKLQDMPSTFLNCNFGPFWKTLFTPKPAKAVQRNGPLPFMGLYYSYIPFPINWKASLCLHAQGADEVVGTPAIDGACMERWDLDFTLRRRMRRGNVWKVTNRSWKKNG